jgi:hypothetical protein
MLSHSKTLMPAGGIEDPHRTRPCGDGKTLAVTVERQR